MKLHLKLINFIGLIVPRRLRADWRQEWEAELRHREALLADWAKLNWRTKLNLLWRSLGAFWDALWLQQLRWEDEMLQDLRYGMRLLRKSPGFSVVAVLSLALGIGANTAVFSVVDAVLLKMLPVEKPEQLVLFRWVSGNKTMVRSFYGSLDSDKNNGLSSSISFSYPAFEYLRDHNQSLSDIFGFARLEQLNVNVDGQSEIAGGQVVTGGYFSGLGVPAILGRTVTDQDDQSGADPAAVISFGYWQRRFGSNPSAIGKVIYLNGTAFTVVGVTPPEFYGTLDIDTVTDISVPIAFQPVLLPTRGPALNDATNWWLFVMGRLQPGASSEQALANLNTALQQHALELQRSFQDQRDLPQLRFDDGSRGLFDVRRGQSKPLSILMGAVALVLLIACINVANLLLARASARQKEIAIRLSVGASRFRLIRQLLTESVMLSLLGGALGLAVAYWSRDAMMTLMSSGSVPLKLDWRVLGFTAAVSLLTGILFGLAPAFRATRLELTPMLKEGAGSTGSARSRLSKTLIVAQVALSLLLLIGAGLFVRTLRNLSNLDVGFNHENLLIFRVQPRMSGYDGERLKNVYQQIIERIEAVPGVRSATLSRHPLLSGSSATDSISVPGYTLQPDEDNSVPELTVGPNFFETMEIPILMGHGFTPQDNQPTSSVVIINQALVRHYFGNQNPVGQHIYLDKFNATDKETRKDRPLEIVGVIRDAKYDSLRGQIRPTVYVPYLQNNSVPTQMSFAVRTAGDPAAMTSAIRQAVHSLDGNLPLFAVKTQNAQIAERVAQSRLFADLSSLFGLLALALVSVGLYGVMSFTVARRTHEIGIRMALGARARDVRRMVMRETLVLTSIGMVIGLGAAIATTRLIASQLFGLSANDPLTIATAVLLLIMVAAVAGGLPARRASRVDPMIALRHE